MNHCVPDFEFDDDYSNPASSVLTRPNNKSVMAEDDVMELLWQNGQVVLQSQNQRSLKNSKFDDTVVIGAAADQSAPREIPSSHHHPQQQQHEHQQDHLFMQEDEMASWLHYPLNDTNLDSDFCADLLYPAPCVSSATTMATATPPARAAHVTESRPQLNNNTSTAASASASRPPIPPPRRMESFGHFTRQRPRAEVSGPSNSKSVMIRESTVVDSSDTPAVGPESRVSEAMRSTEGASGVNSRYGNISGAGATGTSSVGGGGSGSAARDLATCDITVTSSPGCSSASAEPPAQKPTSEDRKRKGRENDDEYHSEDAELESAAAKKQTHGSSSKRSRAAEVHNLSERRRRDRINEKMRALQELIPCCNKSDKASMLDEAIEYLKSLQLQVQMMSMGCGMVPMMFPGVQQYMPNMGMGIGMGMGLDMGMSQPMMPFPNVLAGSAMSTPAAAAAHLGPRFPMPAFHMPRIPSPDPSRAQAANQSNPMLNSFGMQNPNQPRATNFVDPYQQYLALHQMQLQNQSMVQPNASKPSTSKGAENPENHPSG